MNRNEEDLRRALRALSEAGPRKLSGFALWVLANLDELAFHSIRSLAVAAGVDANLVPRLARALGYDGYDPLRVEVQRLVQTRANTYGTRARALRARQGAGVYEDMIRASQQNFDRVTSPVSLAEIDSCAEALLAARHIHTVGVRSCFSVAHYLSYAGSMAFESFVQTPALPGVILDQMSQATPEDVVVAITYEHYSAEVVRACQIARERGARIIALTDAEEAPIAAGAWKTLVLPMAGPQLMPSLASAFLVVEMMLAAMASRSEAAAARIGAFEQRTAKYGGYIMAPGAR
ncbi:MAG: MurR/RpiR family transcriptional regulator [Paracoccaceae bacterium]|jgi:DNA-binding MurR/RpiR family transcriptional regulator